MKVVIDLQGAQASNAKRGIGRYCLSMTKAVLKENKNHEIIIILNGAFPESVRSIKDELIGLIPQVNIATWLPEYQYDTPNKNQRRIAELSLEAFYLKFNPDLILISSLFEGLGDISVTSVKQFNETVPVAVVLYDLIPYIHQSPYLSNPVVAKWYLDKIEHLKKADLLLAISNSSAQEAVDELNFSSSHTVNISAAIEPFFTPMDAKDPLLESVKGKLGIKHRYIMYTGGIDHRKNIDKLIKAYSLLDENERENLQLVIVCSIDDAARDNLLRLSKQYGLSSNELVLTGFVTDEDLVLLYNACELFVFPSWHEGFGLPVLEAMSCGVPVIAGNLSSLPEVAGNENALFDPHDEKSITTKIKQVLADPIFRKNLIESGLEQAKYFSWKNTANRVLHAIEQFNKNTSAITLPNQHKRKLAYVSPLPPSKSGISYYSAELLEVLSDWYDIDVITDVNAKTAPLDKAIPYSIKTSNVFLESSVQYERVLYHFGNSSFHEYMFDLLEKIPGVVVLHDFFLSGIVAHMQGTGAKPNFWDKELGNSIGYRTLLEKHTIDDTAKIVWKYPCNQTVIENALDVIVHSRNSIKLSNQWLSCDTAKSWSVIPHLRKSVSHINDKTTVKRELNFNESAFLTCSFGIIGAMKQSMELLEAWLSSDLSKDENSYLVFVGQNNQDTYGETLSKRIQKSPYSKRIIITGWADEAVFEQYLKAADIAVQLRTLSRGETSGTVLDCMNYGIPTIVNANGSMADLSNTAVEMLPDDFIAQELIDALEHLWRSTPLRDALSKAAREEILTNYAPKDCAKKYYNAIETAYKNNSLSCREQLLQKIALSNLLNQNDTKALNSTFATVAKNFPSNTGKKKLFIDISELVIRDSKSGIQRVVKNVLSELLAIDNGDFIVLPVYANADELGYRHARQFTTNFLKVPNPWLYDDFIDAKCGDIFLGLDLSPHVVPAQERYIEELRHIGVVINFVIYDLLPITNPHHFTSGAKPTYTNWLNTLVRQSDRIIAISHSVQRELKEWLTENTTAISKPELHFFHLGADINNAEPSKGLPNNAQNVLQSLSKRSTFLMVGTIEPRKGQAQTLAAFDLLWANGVDVNLTIVGKQGWLVDELIKNVKSHPESGKRLFWLDNVSDEYLKHVYAASTCLIAASEGEGFGLPLIEATQHKLPIIARDIPVFKEVAGNHAFYFNGLQPESLSNAVKAWLDLKENGQAPDSKHMPWLTWKQSTEQLLSVLLKMN